MKIINKLWILIFVIIVLWIYFLFISPFIFNRGTTIVPNVVGLSEENTKKVLNEANIDYQITYLQSDNELTLKTIPYAGVEIKKTYVLDVYIGKLLPKTYTGFIGQIYEDVSKEIELLCNDYGINLKIIYEDNSNYDSGIIIDESINKGTVLKNGDDLILTISKNDSYFLMPNLVGMNIYDAIELLSDYNLDIVINYYSSPIEIDIILYQSILKDTVIKKGNPYEVTLYVSKGMNINEVSNPYELEEMLVFLGFDVEIYYVKSNAESNKLVAFEVQKLYDNSELRFILFVTE